jgi:hypothetical protein
LNYEYQNKSIGLNEINSCQGIPLLPTINDFLGLYNLLNDSKPPALFFSPLLTSIAKLTMWNFNITLSAEMKKYGISIIAE